MTQDVNHNLNSGHKLCNIVFNHPLLTLEYSTVSHNMRKKVFIDGSYGTAGLYLTSLLSTHPHVELLTLPEDSYKDTTQRQQHMAAADLIIFCVPSKDVKAAIALAPKAAKLIDCSNQFRVSNTWVYGLPELSQTQHSQIKTAHQVANPGCFATGFILAIAPLIQANILPLDIPLHAFAISGYSAGGNRMIALHEANKHHNKAFSLNLDHQHLVEMTQYCRLQTSPLFIPTVASHREGMLLCITIDTNVPRLTFLTALQHHFDNHPFVEVHSHSPSNLNADFPACHRTEMYVSNQEKRLTLSVRLNNLMKGAASAACQNMNLMLGFDEWVGLN
jgi:N-acetyl-gamma-glutamyl-phosphate reductase